MCAAKKQEAPSAIARVRKFTAWLFGPGRPFVISILLFGLFGGGAWFAWRKHRDRILGSAEYRIGAEQVEITPLPNWIHSDIRADVFRDPRLDGPLSIMDDELVDRVREAFAQHPWVAKVTRVVKQYPASVKVDLVYRQPICTVAIPGDVLAVLVVDAEGVVLPSEDFSPVEASRYPCLVDVDRKPVGPAGRRWGDAKVIGGAEIAAALGPACDVFKIRKIVPLPADPTVFTPGGSGVASREPFFALETQGKKRILWGYAPGANMLGELPPVEKIARLKQYMDDHGSLDVASGQQHEIDVRTLPRRRASQY